MSADKIVAAETRRLELEVQKFELQQRMGKALATSVFFPDTLKGDVASAVVIYDLAERMGLSVLEVAQNIYIIHGRPAFSTAFLVARLNESGRIRGALKTVVSDDGQSAYSEAVDATTGETLRGMTVTTAMARREGWATKRGSKWQTMPELMLRKRAQTFFIREFFPETMFGIRPAEEVEDIIDAETVAPNETDEAGDLDALLLAPRSEPESDEEPKPIEEPKPKAAEPVESETKPAPSMARYHGLLIRHGVNPEDLERFIEENELTVEAMQTLKDDPGGLDAMVETFREGGKMG